MVYMSLFVLLLARKLYVEEVNTHTPTHTHKKKDKFCPAYTCTSQQLRVKG